MSRVVFSVVISNVAKVMDKQNPTFGLPWPDLNEGILYKDVVRSSSSTCSLLEFYTTKHKDSAPREGDGNQLIYHRLPWREPPAPWKLEVLYEDCSLLAVNKPSGLQVLPGGLFQQRTVLTQLKWRQKRHGTNPTDRDCSSEQCFLEPSPIHRLGRGTSGVLLCAKSKAAKSKLSSDFTSTSLKLNYNVSSRRVVKQYRALASGIIQMNQVFISHPIGAVPYPGVSKGLYIASLTGKEAETEVIVLSRNEEDNCTLVEVEIFSGRPHQIRIHLAYIGHPLVGDPLYVAGGKPCLASPNAPHGCDTNQDDGGYCKPANAVPGDCGYHLHAHRLSIFHPITEKFLKIVAPLPPMLCTPEEKETILQRK